MIEKNINRVNDKVKMMEVMDDVRVVMLKVSGEVYKEGVDEKTRMVWREMFESLKSTVKEIEYQIEMYGERVD